MNTKTNSKTGLHKLESYLFNIGILTGIATMAFGLVSCGGGGGDGGSSSSTSGSTAAAISRMTTISAASSAQARGTLAASSPQALSISGTNFGSGVSGVTVSIATPGGGTVNYSPSSVTPTKIIANVTILSVPTDRYVTVTVQTAANGSTSGILGVAQNFKTIADIQTIFASNSCLTCHNGGDGGLYLNSSSVSATNLIEADSNGCSQKQRVKAGDPRQVNNVLIDVLKAKTNAAVMTCNTYTSSPDRRMPQGVASAVSATDINSIIDWISLGAI